MLILLALICALLAMACLCAGMMRNAKMIFPAAEVSNRQLLATRVLGVVMLVLSLLCLLACYSLGIGIVAWLSVLTLMATISLLLLSWRPRWLYWLGPVLPALLA